MKVFLWKWSARGQHRVWREQKGLAKTVDEIPSGFYSFIGCLMGTILIRLTLCCYVLRQNKV